jgi:hypothetical protein
MWDAQRQEGRKDGGVTTQVRAQLQKSTGMLAMEHARLARAIEDMEKQMAATKTGAEAQTLAEQMSAHRAAIVEIERQQEAAREAEAQRRAETAAAARRASLTGHSAALVDAHAAKLEALERAEALMAEMVSAANDALGHEATERAASVALVQQLGVERTPLSFSREETVRRLVGGVCQYLTRLSACRMRQLSYLSLPPNPHTDDAAGWAEREAKATKQSVELLLSYSEVGARQ